MRTTIELTNSQRAKLLNLAAQRGEKGFSRLVQQAIDHFLENQGQRKERINAALALEGSLSEESAAALESSITKLRGSWR